jgi:hypothetical protein
VEDKREPVRVLMPGKGWVAAELLYERDGHCRVQVPGDKPRTVLASRVKRAEWVSRHAITVPAGPGLLPPIVVTHVDHASRTMSVGLRAVPKPPKPMRDAAYLAFVREQPCCVGRDGATKSWCDGPVVAHHHGPRGMGQKTDDYRCVPLCDRHHREFHDTGTIGDWSDALDAAFARRMTDLLVERFRRECPGAFVDALVEALRGER